jgi:hypothetical protein
LDDIVIRYLLSQKRETSEIDFKEIIDIQKNADFCKIVKDIFAMSNYGGGYLVIGFRETPTGRYDPAGVPESYHIDQATIQEKFNAYSNEPLVLDYCEIEKEIENKNRKFAILYVPPSPIILKPIKYATYFDPKVNREKKLFSRDEIFIRRGTQSVHASLNEIKFIESRVKQTEYKISLLSGDPDAVNENLFGNFFPVLKQPEFIYEAEIPENLHFSYFETRQKPYVRPKFSGKLYSFCDLSGEPFGKYLLQDSQKRIRLEDWITSENGKNILIRLLNTELRYVALENKLKFAGKKNTIFFYPTKEKERYEAWEGRFRKTRKRVAFKTYIPETGETVFAHDAAQMRFQFIGDHLYLSILPKVVTTIDGFNITIGPDEGPLKTHLAYDKFNDGYLNLILFWKSRFKKTGDKSLNIHDRVLVSEEPTSLTLDYGIRQDRPAEEFHERADELYSLEAVDLD